MRLLISACLILLGCECAAQVKIDSRESLLDYADKHAAIARQAKLQPLIAKDDQRLVSSSLYPRVNAFSTGDYYPLVPTMVIPAEVIGGAPGTFIKAQFGLPFVFTAGAEISMPLVNLEKWTQIAKAKAQYQRAEWSSKAALESFHIQVLSFYYQALVAKEVVDLQKENARTADTLLRIISQRNKQGIVEPSVNNRSHNLLLDVKTAEISAGRLQEQAVNNLQSLLNIEGEPLELSETLEDFDWSVPLPENIAAQRPAWQEANLNVRIAELSLSESRKGALPRLTLNGRYAYNMQSKLENGGQNIEFNVANLGLRLDFPLFQGMYYRTSIHKSKLQLQWAELEKTRVQSGLARENDEWSDQYKAAYSKQAILKDKVATATDNLRIANLNMKEGVMEFDEYNNIFREFNQARIEYLQNLADGILYYLLSTENL